VTELVFRLTGLQDTAQHKPPAWQCWLSTSLQRDNAGSAQVSSVTMLAQHKPPAWQCCKGV